MSMVISRPAFHEVRTPAHHVAVIGQSGHFGTETARPLREYGSDHTIGRALSRVPHSGPPMQKPITMNLLMPR